MIHIITDSTSDMTHEEAAELKIAKAPLTVHFGDTAYSDGVDITPDAFYKLLSEGKDLPTTSQAPPAAFEELLKPILAKGDEAVIVTIASALSATYQSAVIATQNAAPDKVHIVDSRTASGGLALLLRHAARMRDSAQYTAGQIADELRELGPRVVIYGAVDTLKYLWKGGRVSRGKAVMGNLLNVTPVVMVRDGAISVADKARGEKGSLKTMLRLFENSKPDLEYGVAFMHGDVPERMERYIEAFQPVLDGTAVYRARLGSVIGTHTGPGIVAMAFINRE
ncbi:MAG: DegV family protein [Eubacteriales bacterium]|jgi:DegV family protein with EDD domain|nr:DegV family protein [Eubacteriales bacterium]MDD4105036.1 DegV family protein [Eubacteriales bacterium]MDD4711550.1 DegV family protein [Eubacteriales bacterium]NLO14493.1 DegV family protein [Clostridiales bacterium]